MNQEWQTNGASAVSEIPEIPTLEGLHDVGWQHDLVRLVEGEFASQRGRLISGYLAYSGLVDDPLAFLADYESNRAANAAQLWLSDTLVDGPGGRSWPTCRSGRRVVISGTRVQADPL